MAAESRTEDLFVEDAADRTDGRDRFAAVEEVLRKVPQEFQFFQLVRLLERLHPDRKPVGGFGSPAEEIARFTANPDPSFPASQVQQVHWPEDGSPRVEVNFMGLNGPSGLLPLYYTHMVTERMRAKDTALRSFFDLFNHRMVSLFYQAWEKYRFPIAYERGERDRFSHHLLDLIGLGTAGLQERQNIADDSLLFYSGLFALQSRSATALQVILSDYFNVPVEIEQFVGEWQPLDEETQCLIDRGEPYSEQLGAGAIVGDEVWDQQSGVRVRIGPLPLRQYLDFLPNGTAYRPVRALTRFFSGGELHFELQLVLERDEVPPCHLAGDRDTRPLLGWTSWASSRPFSRHPDETILRI